jgi:hypothetical protein
VIKGLAGSNLTYTVTVTNRGANTASAVRMGDVVPDGGRCRVAAGPTWARVAARQLKFEVLGVPRRGPHRYSRAVSVDGFRFPRSGRALPHTQRGHGCCCPPLPLWRQSTLSSGYCRRLAGDRADQSLKSPSGSHVSA